MLHKAPAIRASQTPLLGLSLTGELCFLPAGSRMNLEVWAAQASCNSTLTADLPKRVRRLLSDSKGLIRSWRACLGERHGWNCCEHDKCAEDYSAHEQPPCNELQPCGHTGHT